MASRVNFQFFDALFFLWAIPLMVIFYFMYDSYRKRKLKNYTSSQMLPLISILPTNNLTYIRRSLLIGAWIFATVALMQPIGNPHYLYEQLFPRNEKNEKKPQQGPSEEIIFLLDASSSMLAKDTRKGTTRFEAAKEMIDAITSKIKGKRVSLYAFTTELIPIVPTTNDLIFLRILAKNVTINPEETAGTDFLNIFSSFRKNWSKESTIPLRTLIILSDGDDTSLEDLTEPLRSQRETEILSPLSHLENLHIETIGIGSDKGAIVPGVNYKGKPVTTRLNAQFLQKISEKGHGRFFIANRETPSRISVEIEASIQSYESQEQIPFRQVENFLVYEHYFQYPLAIALLFMGLIQLVPKTNKKADEHHQKMQIA